jgi:hypothetical protein
LFELFYRLPRELRNHVYTFCVQGPYDDEVIIRRSATLGGSTALLVREYTGRHSYRWIEDPIDAIINASAIQHDYIAREMLEAYYWSRTFKVSHRELPRLGSFLETDKFGLGMIPAAYVRRLQIQLHGDVFVQTRWSEPKWVEYEKTVRIIERLSGVLTKRTEVTIEFDLHRGRQDSLGDTVKTEEMQHLVHAVERLREAEMRITMSCRTRWNE